MLIIYIQKEYKYAIKFSKYANANEYEYEYDE